MSIENTRPSETEPRMRIAQSGSIPRKAVGANLHHARHLAYQARPRPAPSRPVCMTARGTGTRSPARHRGVHAQPAIESNALACLCRQGSGQRRHPGAQRQTRGFGPLSRKRQRVRSRIRRAREEGIGRVGGKTRANRRIRLDAERRRAVVGEKRRLG